MSSRKADRIWAMPWLEKVGNNPKFLADSNKKIYARRATFYMLRKIFYVVRKKNHVVRKKFYVASIFGGTASRKNRPPWEVSSTTGEVSSTAGSFFSTASRVCNALSAFSKWLMLALMAGQWRGCGAVCGLAFHPGAGFSDAG
ncbi:MAG: hypothetical protein MR516_01410 [Bacteroidales bacterium]|nr:hypothetical protein [Bacteroidales bacterium]